MEEKTETKNWGRKLTGGLICAGLVREVVMAEPKTALWGIGAILIIAVAFMAFQYLSDRKGKDNGIDRQ